MSVRAMRREDVPRVLEIARASLPEAWTLEGFAEELAAPGRVALVLGAPIDGYAIGTLTLDQLEVLSIAVHPRARRRGAGRELLAALLDVARVRGATRAVLEVRFDNAAAIALYRGHGFEEVGRRARYYADGTDATIMASALGT